MGTANMKSRDDTLETVIVSLCADFPRRRKSIADKHCSRRVEMEYRYLNYHLTEAAKEIVGENFASLFLYEIGERIGYAHSEATCFSEGMYKQKKHAIVCRIAARLHLSE